MKPRQDESAKLLAIQAIALMQNYLQAQGFTPVLHFELEGCFTYPTQPKNFQLDFSAINKALLDSSIEGKLIPEYWKNQWEYVSLFNGQSPLQEASYLEKVVEFLPILFAKQGIKKTLIKPVVWRGDNRKIPLEKGMVLTDDNRYVHIPNAIQINVSVNDSAGENIIIKHSFGEYLQQRLLETSLDCALLYLPEEEAFSRLTLKTDYNLAKELSSPSDISGGHQGSIALYKQWGKHNQPMGEKVIVYNEDNTETVTFKNWEKTARIEHRLGASSIHYCPYVNTAYILMNVICSVEHYVSEDCEKQLSTFEPCKLPESLYTKDGQLGAIELFQKSEWFNATLNHIEERVRPKSIHTDKLGDALKAAILNRYLYQ